MEIKEEYFEGMCKTCTKRRKNILCFKIPISMPEDFSCEEYDHEGTCETCTVKDCEIKGIGVLGCEDWRGK